MEIVYAGEEMCSTITKSLFLAGPTSRNKDEVESWRKDALQILRDKGFDGTVFVPEPRDGEFKLDYDDQVGWEEKYLNVADCIVFWVPRNLEQDSKGYPKMAGLTTNVEFGTWQSSGKIVFGAPEDAEKVSYLKHYAEKYKVPLSTSLVETLDNAIEILGEGDEREGGERYIPLFIWKLDSFQSWYKVQKKAGNRLEKARLLFNFRPGFKDFVFLWALHVEIYVADEDRVKSNEVVFARPDISSVLLWSEVDSPQGNGIIDMEVVLVKEFRSPASTKDGFIRELPGGSSFKKDEDPYVVAAEEVYEETGFYLDPSRLEEVNTRQLAGTFSAHKSNLFKVHLTTEEMDWFKSQDGIVHGNEEDSERTFIEVHNVYDLVNNNLTDWSTLGMILSVLAS